MNSNAIREPAYSGDSPMMPLQPQAEEGDLSQKVGIVATNPKLLVTGLPHSGTTYVMQLISACGWDLGRPLHEVNERKGLEWEPLLQLAMDANPALGCSTQPDKPDWNRVRLERRDLVGRQFKERIETLDWPPAVKSPLLHGCADVIFTYRKPGHVILTQRSLDDWVVSMWGNVHARRNLTRSELFHSGALSTGLLLDAVEKQDIPYTLVSYPRVARDKDYAWAKLGALLEVSKQVFEGAYEATTRPDWLNWTERNLDISGDRFGLRAWPQATLRSAARGLVRRLRKVYFGRVE